MEVNEKKIKPKIWLNLNFWFGIIGVIGFLFSIYTFIYTAKPELKYYVLANTSVLDVKEKVNNLTVTYDSINILESNLNISIILLEVKNIGTKDITLNDYDQKSIFGVKIIGGKLLKKPELISSSDTEYFGNVISNFTNNQIKFNCKLIDQDQYFRVKLLVLHPKNHSPKIESIGKISGMDKIEVLNPLKLLKTESSKLKYKLIVSLVLLFLLFLLFIIKLHLSNKSYIELLLETIKSKNSLVDSFEENSQNLKNVLEFENLNEVSSINPKVDNAHRFLSFEEKLNLKTGDFIFHEKFGRGEIINIELSHDTKNSKGDFKFEMGGDIKKLLLRFAPLYKK